MQVREESAEVRKKSMDSKMSRMSVMLQFVMICDTPDWVASHLRGKGIRKKGAATKLELGTYTIMQSFS